MVTRAQIEEALGEDKDAFKIEKNIDYDARVIILLRYRIPYEVCKRIIGAAEHDQIFLCDVEDAMNHLTEEDLVVLADCNCFIESDHDCLSLFV